MGLSSIFLLGNCSDFLECDDKLVGDIHFDEGTKVFLPLDPTKMLVFKNEAGNEMRFRLKETTHRVERIDKRCICQDINLDLHYEYFNADKMELLYVQDTSFKWKIELEFTLLTRGTTPLDHTNEEAALYDMFMAKLGSDIDDYDSTTDITYLTSDRGSDPAELEEVTSALKYRIIKDTTFIGKHFINVIASAPPLSPSPNNKYALYYLKNKGPIAFSTADGTVYVFDREQ